MLERSIIQIRETYFCHACIICIKIYIKGVERVLLLRKNFNALSSTKNIKWKKITPH